MKDFRLKTGHVNYSFEAAVGIAYNALGKEWGKIDYIREYYQVYCFENVGSNYKSSKVPLYVSKVTGECRTEQQQKAIWEEEKDADFAIGTMNSDLPLQRVHFGQRYFAFSDSEACEAYFCSCHQPAIENEIELFERYYQYDSALNDRMQLLLSYHMQMPSLVDEAVKASGIPHGEGLFKLFEYKDHICHLCNGVNPKIHYGMFAKGSKFKQQYSQYLHVRFNTYGLDDYLPDHFGIYFIEERLPQDFKKMLIPTMEEILEDIVVLNELGEADKNAALVELKKIWSLSTEERYVLMYDQQMSRILREKGLLTAYDLCKSLGIDTDVYSMLQDAIWKRYKKIVKIVNDEVKAMAKGAK